MRRPVSTSDQISPVPLADEALVRWWPRILVRPLPVAPFGARSRMFEAFNLAPGTHIRRCSGQRGRLLRTMAGFPMGQWRGQTGAGREVVL